MSLRILFADDSMTAQNMGKKILSEAGYDVVAVSNGAAAVKKIAEQKPDIIILDVYMPGYTGLEVCEKVRGSMDTLKTPVLLTVGKLEPYKPEDANRVKADGVIIKPFEASDLLAIVKKFEERIGNAAAIFAQAAAATSLEEETPAETPMETQTPSNRANMQPMVEVPDHMASSAAFGDMLGGEPASAPNHFAVNSPSAAFETSVIVPAPPIVVGDETAALPKVEQPPVAVAPEPEQPSPEAVMPEMDAAPEVTVTPVETDAAPEAAAVHDEPAPEAAAAHAEPAYEAVTAVQPEAGSEIPHPQFIPVFKEPGTPAAHYDLVPTAAAPVDDIEIPREPALQENAEETTRNTVTEHVEPGLMSAIEQAVGTVHEQEEQAPVAAEAPMPAPATGAPSDLSDADFEARVAAAMAAYNHATETDAVSAPAEPTGGLEPHEVPAAQATAAEVPSFEYHPAAGSAEPEAVGNAQHEPQAEVPAPIAGHAEVATGMEAAIPEAAAAAAVESGADHQTIAQAIHRVMERLKPELVEEIMKELRPKK